MVRTAGWLVVIYGVALAIRSVMLLRGRGRPKRGPTPAFVIAGPYCRIRNPLLAGVVLALTGAALALASSALAWLAALTAAASHLWVTSVEEPRLRARFGPAYAAYLEHVPRWLPRRRDPDDPDRA